MITVGYSTREHNPKFIEYLKKSSGNKKIEVIEKINNGEKSLSQVYNEILEESKTDIVVLVHDDIYFDTTSWYYKIKSHFEESDYGILGVAGTTEMSQTGRWWDSRRKMIGVVNHESGGKKWTSKYSDEFGKSIKQTILVDGLFIALSKSRIKNNFDEEFKGFHFYDIGFCFRNHLDGVKIGVITNVRITHKSIGQTNEQWEENRQFFVEKYNNNLPSKIPFDPTTRLKVLLSCISFKPYTFGMLSSKITVIYLTLLTLDVLYIL
jgi:glycosyltransferase involved in cell wall biosynthesis